jgi:uncharacterized tellurite resistance protein B-like protein
MTSLPFDILEAQEIVRALAAVAAADGAVVAREVTFLDGFANAYGIGGHAWFAMPLDEVSLARAVGPVEKRRQVVELCVKMAVCDSKYTAEEVTLIERIASALNVSSDELAEITRTAS